jgi:hypothetical protein
MRYLNSKVGSKKYNVNIELLSGVSQRVYIYIYVGAFTHLHEIRWVIEEMS